MKKDFKTRIAEIAAKIAENNSDEFKDYFEGYVAELLDKSMPDEVKKVGEAIIKKYPELKKSDISYNMSRDSAGNIDSIKGEIFNGMTMKSFMKFDFKFKDNQMTNLNSAMTIANVNEAYDDNKMEQVVLLVKDILYLNDSKKIHHFTYFNQLSYFLFIPHINKVLIEVYPLSPTSYH